MVPKHLGGILGGQLGEQQGGRERSLKGSFLWARAMAGWVRRGRPALPACEMDVWRPNVPDNALLPRVFCVLPFNCNAIPVDGMKRVLLYFALLAKFMK